MKENFVSKFHKENNKLDQISHKYKAKNNQLSFETVFKKKIYSN